jgi:hypothetical protein
MVSALYTLCLLLCGLVHAADFMDADVPCDILLRPATSSLRLNPAQSIENFHKYAELSGIATSLGQEQSVLEWLKVNPADYPQIVLFSLNNFLGDSLIFHFSIIDYFLKTYPQVPLRFISPKAGLLARMADPSFSWRVFPVRFAEYRKREDRDYQINFTRRRLHDFVKENVMPGALVFFDLTTLDKADAEIDPKGNQPELRLSTEFHRLLMEAKATAIGLSNLRKERIMLGVSGIEVLAPPSRLRPELADLPESHPIVSRSGETRGYTLRTQVEWGAKTIYKSWLENFTLLFGPAAYLKWTSAYFVHPQEDAVLVQQFFDEQHMDSKTHYVMINFNTYGADKVRDLIPLYSQALKAVMAHILNTTAFNILVNCPETQFGPENIVAVLDAAAENKSRVALISTSKREIMSALISNARWFISYDSGPVHLASFFPPERVLTFSLHSGGPEIWRKEDQEYIKLPLDGPVELLISQINAWVDSRTQELLPKPAIRASSL